MGKTVVHTVKKGESLDRIAKSFGLKSFNAIYGDPVNAKFRKLRPKPDLILPGDKIIIPNFALTPEKRKNLKTLIATVEQRIKRLEDRKKDMKAMSESFSKEIRKSQAGFKKTMNAVDGAAMMVGFVGAVTKIAVKGHKMTTMAAKDVSKANVEILKDLAKMHTDALSPALAAGAKKMASSSSRFVSGIGLVADAFCNMSSPSFWAKTIIKANEEGLIKKVSEGKFGEGWEAWGKAVTWDPSKEFDRINANMRVQYGNLIRQIDLLLFEDRKILKSLKEVAALK